MDEFSEVIWQSEDGLDQLRVEVTKFRDNLYLSIRYWYMSFDEEWCPTNKGITLPYTTDNITRLCAALSLVLSETEIELYFNKANQK